MKKWTYELVVVIILVAVGLSIWWFIATGDERVANARYEQFVKFANRQTVEITIIKQAAELEQLKRILAENQKSIQAIDSKIGGK